jgi:DNA-binding transcriptional LysR family regulator
MKWNIDDIPVFLAVVEQSGITAAARSLDMPKATVSKSVTRLEQALGLRLLERTSRSLRVTSEGQTFYRQAFLIMEQVRAADATMAGLNAVPSGRLVVALPPAFCQEIVSPSLAVFHERYPQVELDLIITSQRVDMLRDQVDVALVVGPQDDSDMVSKTLFSGRLIWVTSPAYARTHRLGKNPAALVKHVQLCEKRYGTRRMPVRVNGHAAQVDLSRGITHLNDPLSVRRAVMSGAGVSVLPWLYCREQIAEGTLVEVGRHIAFDLSASKLSVVYPSRRLISPKTRAFLDFIDDICPQV